MTFSRVYGIGYAAYALLPQFQPSHFDEVLGDFRYSLFALVNGEVWPVNQFFVDLNAEVNGHI